MKEGRNGVTANTPGNTLFGAGTIHKGLKYAAEAGWNFAESVVGATTGGSSFTITPEITTVEVDGAWVPVKELRVKTGEAASMQINFTEITEDIIKAAIFAAIGESDDAEMKLMTTKPDIEEGDYWENIAFVGRTLKDNKKIIVIMGNALCTSGLSIEGKSKEASIGTYTFECNADLEGDLDTLPIKIYYP